MNGGQVCSLTSGKLAGGISFVIFLYIFCFKWLFTLKPICTFYRWLQTNYTSCHVPTMRLLRQFYPDLLQRHIPWEDVQEPSVHMPYYPSCSAVRHLILPM